MCYISNMDTQHAKRIIMAYTRCLVKARSNVTEACAEYEHLARDMDPVLFGDGAERLLTAMGASLSAPAGPSPTDAMNFSHMLGGMALDSRPLAITIAAQLSAEWQRFLREPAAAMRAVM